MNTRFRVRSISFLATFGLGLATALHGNDSPEGRIQLASKFEAVIPAQLLPLLLDNPTVNYFVTVNEDGKLVDFLALEAAHYGLLERAELTFKQAVFSPGLVAGKPAQGSGEVRVTFFDPEQQALRSGIATRPFGLNQSEALSRRVYETSKARYVYRRAEPAELDQPVTQRETKILVLTDANGKAAVGACVVDFFINPLGEVHAPRVVSSENETVALSALLTLQHTRYAPISRANGVPGIRESSLADEFQSGGRLKAGNSKLGGIALMDLST